MNILLSRTSIKFIFICSSLMILSITSPSITSAEITDGVIARDKLKIEVRTLLHQGKYLELENMADKFRTGKTRFPDGGWKLLAFYGGLKDPYYGWNELFRNLKAWLKKYPHSITARVAAGEAWSGYAWEARGNNYANAVNEEGWKLMRERIVKAYGIIKDPPGDPSKDCMQRYRLLLSFAKVQGWDRQQYEIIFQKAISFEPLYYAYYSAKADYLLPRWNGEKGEWQRFANAAVKLTPASEGMGIYTRILITIWELNEFREFREPDISWKKMKQGFRDIERQYPNSPSNLNHFCMFACIAGDKETAKELFKKIGDEPYTEVWKGRSNFMKWQRWAGIN